MYLRTQRKCLRLTADAIRVLVAMLVALLCGPDLEAKTATVSGVIFTLDSARVQTVWPNARVTLKSLDTNNEVATVSNDLGTYAFTGVLNGQYEITITLAGFVPITRRLAIGADNNAKVDFQLVPQGRTETITVKAEEPGVDLTSSYGGASALNANDLKSLVRLN